MIKNMLLKTKTHTYAHTQLLPRCSHCISSTHEQLHHDQLAQLQLLVSSFSASRGDVSCYAFTKARKFSDIVQVFFERFLIFH